jgi:lipopolysaccharide transport system ATP-binding protein
MPHIKFENLSIRFPINNFDNITFKRILFNYFFKKKIQLDYIDALKNITFEINNGDYVGIHGDNGSGKTTLLKAICGIYHPTNGIIKVQGKIISFIDLFHSGNLDATGIENIYLKLMFNGINGYKNTKVVKNIIEFADLGNFINLPVKTLSTGMILRLFFSILVHCDGDIILMDEWISVGDQKFQLRAEEKIMHMIYNSKIFVLASQSKDIIEKKCNKKILLKNGEILKSI